MTGGAAGDTFDFQAAPDSPWKARNARRDQGFHGGCRYDRSGSDRRQCGGWQGIRPSPSSGMARSPGTAGELQVPPTFGDNTMVSADVDGNGRADFQVLLAGHVTLQATDFML